MKQFLKKLNEPFPEDTSLRHNVQSIIGIGLFVTFFLYFLRPFGLHDYPKNPIWICLRFGVLTILAGIVYDLFGTYVLNLKKDGPSWTLWKWIINAIGIVLFISICNYLFMTFLMGWGFFNWYRFTNMLFSTFIVGIFPIIFSGMIVQMNAYKRNQKQATNLQATLATPEESTQIITVTSQNNSQSLTIPITDLLYIEAMQNYVAIGSIQEGKFEKALFRNTITQMEVQLANTSLFRCHRSFLVNIHLIENVAGNAQGLRLTLKELPDVKIPVSRKYIPALKKLITKEENN